MMILSAQQHLQSILTKHKENIEVKLKGRFKLMVHREGRLIEETGWFSNMILDQGLNYLGTMSLQAAGTYVGGPMGYAQVGTGTDAPLPSQTQLQTWLASVLYSNTTYYESSGAPNWEGTTYQYYQFAAGAITTPISEVGVGRVSNGQLFSRAQVTDSYGFPMALPVTSQDQLTIVYALTIVPTLTAATGSVVLEGVTYNWSAYMTGITLLGSGSGNLRMPNPSTGRPFMGVAYSSGLIQGQLCAAGTPLSPTVLTDNVVPNAPAQVDISSTVQNTTYSYVNGSYSAKSTVTIPPALGNFSGGIQCVSIRFAVNDLGVGYRVLYYFSSPIAKTNVKVLTLGFTATWARAS